MSHPKDCIDCGKRTHVCVTVQDGQTCWHCTEKLRERIAALETENVQCQKVEDNLRRSFAEQVKYRDAAWKALIDIEDIIKAWRTLTAKED